MVKHIVEILLQGFPVKGETAHLDTFRRDAAAQELSLCLLFHECLLVSHFLQLGFCFDNLRNIRVAHAAASLSPCFVKVLHHLFLRGDRVRRKRLFRLATAATTRATTTSSTLNGIAITLELFAG